MHNVVVFTGDFIDSTTAGRVIVDQAMAVLEALFADQARSTGTDIRFARYRGDGWQAYAENPAEAFRLALLVLAELRRHPALPPTRLAVAIGPCDPMPPHGLAAAGGKAFVLSGTALDNMGRNRMILVGPGATPDRKALFAYLDWQADRWSPEQAEAIALACHNYPPQPHKVEAELGISRQAAAARLKGAGYAPVAATLIAFATAPAGELAHG